MWKIAFSQKRTYFGGNKISLATINLFIIFILLLVVYIWYHISKNRGANSRWITNAVNYRYKLFYMQRELQFLQLIIVLRS